MSSPSTRREQNSSASSRSRSEFSSDEPVSTCLPNEVEIFSTARLSSE